MKKFLALTVLILLAAPAVFAVPTLQLYIDGASYDNSTDTWVTSGTSFNLYVVGKGDLTNVTLGMALDGVGEFEDPSASSVTIDGTGFPTSSWTYGYAPLLNDPSVWDGGNKDLPKHDIFPAWYTEFGLGDFTAQGGIGDVHPDSTDFWAPTSGYINSQTQGWFQSYSISITGGQAVHFDAYTLDSNGEIIKFNPLSHDAEGGGKEVPEPATMLLFGIGLAGAGAVKRFRKN